MHYNKIPFFFFFFLVFGKDQSKAHCKVEDRTHIPVSLSPVFLIIFIFISVSPKLMSEPIWLHKLIIQQSTE